MLWKMLCSIQQYCRTDTNELQIVSREITDNNVLKFIVHGSGLDKKDFLGKSDPFLQLCKRAGDKLILIHQTEVSRLIF